MKVLFLSHQSDFIYGGEVCTLELMRTLKGRGLEVFFAAPPGPYFERAKEVATCFPISSIQFQRRLLGLPRFLSAFVRTQRELRKIVELNAIDLVHATSLKATVYTMGFSLAPVLWHHHDILPKGFRNNKWLQFIAHFVCHIFTPSEAARNALLEAGVAAEKVSTLYNGFSLSTWKPRNSRLGQRMRLACIGEISERKGSDWIKPTADLLVKKGIEFDWQVIGAALSEPEFASEVQKNCAPISQIRFLGRRNDVASLLQEIDFLLVPSRQDPLPTVIVEAFLSGVPVIGTSAGGIPEMIQDGENGYLVNSPQEIAEKISATTPASYAMLSQSARKSAEEKFSSERMSELVVKRYKIILQ